MGKIFHEGPNAHLQDYEYGWTLLTTNTKGGIWEATGGPQPSYIIKTARMSWFAFGVENEEMTETMLAELAVEAIRNVSRVAASQNARAQPFFLAVGFLKPHVP